MPVFFYIDPEFAEDPKMETVDTLTLSYTFFEAKPGLKLPIPSYVKQWLAKDWMQLEVEVNWNFGK